MESPPASAEKQADAEKHLGGVAVGRNAPGTVGTLEHGLVRVDRIAGGGDFALAFELHQAFADLPPHVALLYAPAPVGRKPL